MLKRFLISCLMISAFPAFAQDPALTQYHSVPAYLNPGFTGSNGCGKAAGAYRNQWPKTPGRFVSSLLSYEHYLHKLCGGLGLNYLHDEAGEIKLTTDRLELTYAAHLELMEKKLILRPGIGVAWARRSVDWSNLTFGDMIDPRRGFVYTPAESGASAKDYLDLAAGIVYSTKYVYGGFALHHINEPKESLLGGSSRLPMRFTAHIAGMIGEPDEEKKFCLSPHALFMQQQDFRQLLGGVTAKYDKFLLGLAYRNEDSFIIQAAFQNALFRVGYSYDHTISKLTYATGGSHELTTSFNILHKREKQITPVRTIAF